MLSFTAAAALALAWGAQAGSLADIDHVVLFMQENRAFDHYFGTMAGVRGFKDPTPNNAQGQSTFVQEVDSTLSNKTTELVPWYLNYLGGDWLKASQCMSAGSNGWSANHLAINGDLNNHWALKNTPWSWGYYKRSDLPVHFAITEGWTIGDAYQDSVVSSTNPNRVAWISGSINVAGGPQSPDQGGPVIDNNETPGCETGANGATINCYPYNWPSAPDFYSKANVSWQVYQDTDNFDDNPLAWSKEYQEASNTSELYERGMSFLGLDAFYKAAKEGTLPEVSYIVGPAELSEHPPYTPHDGAWLHQQVLNAVVTGKNYAKTALIVSYDESGGWGDHAIPYHSPEGTAGEWMEDPYNGLGQVYSGPGVRVPFYIVSPWTRGGHVFTERADHSSQIKFIEEWQKAKGKNVVTDQIPAWRRAHMSDLTKAFDFNNPDYSIPSIPTADTPTKDSDGNYNGYSVCEATYKVTRPPVPYGLQNTQDWADTESGFKCVRGLLTEGRYLTFESQGYALTAKGKSVTATKATSKHDSIKQRWVIHQVTDGGQGAATVTVTSAVDGRYIGSNGKLTKQQSQAATFQIVDQGNGAGYTIETTGGSGYGYGSRGSYVSINGWGQVSFGFQKGSFSVYSVTY